MVTFLFAIFTKPSSSLEQELEGHLKWAGPSIVLQDFILEVFYGIITSPKNSIMGNSQGNKIIK
jgi:hypothetical protein